MKPNAPTKGSETIEEGKKVIGQLMDNGLSLSFFLSLTRHTHWALCVGVLLWLAEAAIGSSTNPFRLTRQSIKKIKLLTNSDFNFEF